MPDGVNTWQAEELSEKGRTDFFEAARQHRETRERLEGRFNRVCWMIAVAGCAVGILGMGCGLVAYVKSPVQQPPGYIPMDRSTGWIGQDVSAKDAPIYYSEATRQRAIRDFITACTSYLPQTWATIDWHACMIQATPDEQKRLAADLGKGAPDYPPAVFGQNGWAMASSFPAMDFKGKTGKAGNETYHYEVYYRRTEVINGRPIGEVPYTGHIYFSFHPEMKMSRSDRQINPSGLQVSSFTAVKD